MAVECSGFEVVAWDFFISGGGKGPVLRVSDGDQAVTGEDGDVEAALMVE